MKYWLCGAGSIVHLQLDFCHSVGGIVGHHKPKALRQTNRPTNK